MLFMKKYIIALLWLFLASCSGFLEEYSQDQAYEKKDALLIAIEEGRTIVKDPNAPRYSSMEGLKAALEV